MTARSDPRTYLFVPGNRPDRFRKALVSGADAVVLDLEDAVAADAKDAAREDVRAWAADAAPADRARAVVRTNDLGSSHAARDLAAAATRESMPLIFDHDRPQLRQFPNLVS